MQMMSLMGMWSDSIVVVVDSAGVFRHRVAWCACDKDLPMQLFREGLFPA